MRDKYQSLKSIIDGKELEKTDRLGQLKIVQTALQLLEWSTASLVGSQPNPIHLLAWESVRVFVELDDDTRIKLSYKIAEAALRAYEAVELVMPMAERVVRKYVRGEL